MTKINKSLTMSLKKTKNTEDVLKNGSIKSRTKN